MALALLTTTGYGVTAAYHKISVTSIDWHRRESRVFLVSYVDQEARESGVYPIANVEFFWNGDEFPFQFDQNNVQQAYTKIKSLPEWSTAVDV